MLGLTTSLVMQFEDPTDELQILRESVDVERASSIEWLPELAAKVF